MSSNKTIVETNNNTAATDEEVQPSFDITKEEILDINELSGILKLQKGTIYKKIKSGTLPKPITVSGHYRWLASEINKMIVDDNQRLNFNLEIELD